MKYLTATEAAKRIGVTDRTVRDWIQAGKLTAHHPAKNRLAIPEPEVERIARERKQYEIEQPDVSVLVEKVEVLEQRMLYLESELAKYRRSEMLNRPPYPSLTSDYTPTEEKPVKSRPSASMSTPATLDLPAGTLPLTDFANRYGIPRSTVVHHVKVGYSGDRLEATTRPRPGRPDHQLFYLTPEQQEQAVAYWRRNGVAIREPEE